MLGGRPLKSMQWLPLSHVGMANRFAMARTSYVSDNVFVAVQRCSTVQIHLSGNSMR